MIKRMVATAVILALVWLTPGGHFHEACAQVVASPAARAGAAASAGAAGSINLQLSVPALTTTLPSASLTGTLAAPSIQVSALAVPAALVPVTPVKAATAAKAAGVSLPHAVVEGPKPVELPGVAVPAAASPKTFAHAKTGEAAGVLFDEGVSRSALDVVLPAASSDEKPAGNLEPAKTPAPGAPNEPPAPRAKLPRSMWGLFWGHHITTVFGVNFHVLAQPFLVKDALGMGTATMGLVRNIHMGSMAVVNFLPIGYLIDKTDFRAVFVATSLARAALMAAIPLLFMAGGLHFTILAAIVAVNPIFQSTMLVADGAARKSFLGKDEKLNKDAAATLGKWDSVAGAIMPLVAGWVLGLMVTGFGLGGYAMAYGIYGALLIASIPFYWFMVRDPRFAENDRISPVKFVGQILTFTAALGASVVHPFTLILNWSFNSFFQRTRAEFPSGLAGRSGWVLKELAVALAGAALLPFALLKGLFALPGLISKARGAAGSGRTVADVLEQYKPTQGVAFILRNRTLKILTMVMALEVLLIDALPFVVIPSLITDALGTAPTSVVLPVWTAAAAAGAAFLAAGAKAVKAVKSWKPALLLGGLAAALLGLHVFPGILMTQIATAGGIMGLLFSVEYIGRFIPSVRLEGEKGDAIIEKKGHGSFYRKAAMASLLFWALLAPAFLTTGMFWLNLAIVCGVLFGVQYFHTPVGIVMEPVKRAQMDDDKLARIESAVFMIDLAFESIGALLLGLLLDFAGLGPALIAVAVFLTVTAVLQYNVPRWIFKDGNHPDRTDPPADPPAQAASAIPEIAFA